MSRFQIQRVSLHASMGQFALGTGGGGGGGGVRGREEGTILLST